MAQPLPRTLQPPPELPNDPKTSDVLSNYLRSFSLWCRHGFADKLSQTAAAPGVMLQTDDVPPAVYQLKVTSGPTLALAPMSLGSGAVGDPVPVGTGEFLPLEGGSLDGLLDVQGSVSIHADADAGGNAYVGFFDEGGRRRGYVGWVGQPILYNDTSGAAIAVNDDGTLTVSGLWAGQQTFKVSGSLYNGGVGPHMIEAPPNNDAYISFLVDNQFGAQFGLSSNSYFYIGGWSYGANVYQLWTARDFGNPACDYRIKEDVEPLGSTWGRVRALNPVSYRRKEYRAPNAPEGSRPLVEADDRERWGFVAHELQETLIETAAHCGKDDPDRLQAPDLMAVIAALTRTVQELQARVEQLEAR